MRTKGKPLAALLTEMICGSKFVCDQILVCKSEIIKTWEEVNEIIADDLKITKYPRMEILLSSISYVERYLTTGNFMRGFEIFNEMEFNYNHLLLANLLYHGATIFTADFDLCIEKAYEYLYHEKLISPNKKRKKEYRISSGSTF